MPTHFFLGRRQAIVVECLGQAVFLVMKKAGATRKDLRLPQVAPGHTADHLKNTEEM
jgi:hypothetical protein